MTWAERWKLAATDHRKANGAGPRVLGKIVQRLIKRLHEAEARIVHLEGPSAAVVGRVYSNVDAWLKIAGLADAATFEKLLDGNLDVAVILEHEFEQRFPAEHQAWLAKHGE